MSRIREKQADRAGHRRSSVRSQAAVQDLRHEERLSSYAVRSMKTKDDKIHRSLGWANRGKGVVLGQRLDRGIPRRGADDRKTKKDSVDNRRLHTSDEADL